MRISLRELFICVAVVSVALALSQLPLLVGGSVLVLAVLVAGFVLPAVKWRAIVYGAIAGMLVSVGMLLAYQLLRFGYTRGSNYQEAGALQEAADPVRHYLLPIGAVIGGTVGWRRSRDA